MADKVLIVEDDKDIASHVMEILTQHGYAVERARDGDEAFELLRKSMPALCILDVDLPGLSGLNICQMLRKDPATAHLPIMILTVYKGASHKVQGLEIGADDYLTKPFNPEELAARVKALLRRTHKDQPEQRHILKAGGVMMDLDKHEVTVRGAAVELGPKEYQLLSLFLDKKGHVLTKQFLLDNLWGPDVVATSDTLKQHVKNLRQKLGPAGDNIQAIVGMGYKFTDE